jgi:hypothetical protein
MGIKGRIFAVAMTLVRHYATLLISTWAAYWLKTPWGMAAGPLLHMVVASLDHYYQHKNLPIPWWLTLYNP